MLSPEETTVLEQYFRAEYQDMLRFARVTLKDENLAEVAVQDTFVIASLKFQDLTGSPNPVGWLYNVLKNTIRAHKRERRRMLERCVAWEGLQEPSAEMPPVGELDMEKSADLRLLARLYIQGYSLEEIAADMGITVPALKMRMSRARKRLREDPDIKNLKNFEE